jgi:argininosuccinate lyase
VALAVKEQKDLAELSLEQLAGFSELIGDDVYEVLTLEGSLAARNHLGGTAPAQVKAAVAAARKDLAGRH